MGNSIYTEIIYIKFTNKNIQLLIFSRFADSLSASTQHLGWFFPSWVCGGSWLWWWDLLLDGGDHRSKLSLMRDDYFRVFFFFFLFGSVTLICSEKAFFICVKFMLGLRIVCRVQSCRSCCSDCCRSAEHCCCCCSWLEMRWHCTNCSSCSTRPMCCHSY